DRRPLPVHPQVAGVLGIQRALAIPQAGDEGARALFAQDIAVRQAPLADRALDNRGESARHIAEKPMPGNHQLVGTVRVGAGSALGGGRSGGAACWAEAATVQHISAASVTAARRETKFMKEPLRCRNRGRALT